MGTVVLAEHAGLAQRVVLKLLKTDLAARRDLVDRLRVEAQALSRLSHPNLVRVTDFGTTSTGRAYLAMEHLSGRTVAEELARRRPLPLAEALDVVRQTLAGLGAAHAVGLIHRDVKPENLFLCEDGTLKVLDFGVAKVVAEAALAAHVRPRFSTSEGGVVGTPHFAAPEQLQGGVITASTDVYAVGLVLYELVTGAHPFARHRSADAIHHAQIVEMPRPPSENAPQAIPEFVDRAVMRAIAKRPQDRFASADAFRSALDASGARQPQAPDSRNAPTLASEAIPLLDSAPRTLASPVASESVPTLATLSHGAPPTVVVVTPPPTVETTPPPERVKSEGLGVLCLVAGIATSLWKLSSAFFALPEIVDPIGFLSSIRGSAPVPDESQVSLLARSAAVVGLLDSVLLMFTGAALIVVGIVTMQRTPRGVRWVRRWSHFALVVVLTSAFLNLALVVPLRAMLVSHVPALPDVIPGLEELGFAFGIALLLGTAVLEVGFVLGVRAWAKRLETAR